MPEILEQLNLMNYLKPNVIVSDFRVRLSQLQEHDEGSTILAELSYLKSCGLLKNGDLGIYSLKTSQDFSTTWGGIRLQPLSGQCKTWGIAWNGKCLTADISEYHRIERESSLSDILETDVPNQYFLSQQTIDRLLSYKQTKVL